MKVCVVQPPYSYSHEDMEKNFEKLLSMLDACDESLDLIVLPEYSDIPADDKNNTRLFEAVEKQNPILLERAAATAARCHALLFINAMDKTTTGYRNTTHVFDRTGTCIGKYYKAHPAPSEVKTEREGGHGLDVGYSYEYRPPYVLEVEGLRIGFLTCYDFYFYENFPQLARENLDIIIGCSLQRTDTHEALSIFHRFLSYQTNAYLIRASVSLGEDSTLCGCSTVVTPRGEELVNMKSRVGHGVCEIDPHDKYYKPAGFGGVMKSHAAYIEEGRRPWLYRNGGASVVPFDSVMKYPRLCAHRGFSAAMPENSLPALSSAIALGAEEIEFDLRTSSDGVLVSIHDSNLDRVSNGHGEVEEHTFADLRALDFCAGYTRFSGLQIPTFEEVLQKLAGRVVMNVHVKIWEGDNPTNHMDEIISLVKQYDCAKHAYFASNSSDACREVKARDASLSYCLIWNGRESGRELVERAIAAGADKVQFDASFVDAEAVALAHAHGIRCNLFYADTPDGARAFYDMGCDTVLTNEYLSLKNALGKN